MSENTGESTSKPSQKQPDRMTFVIPFEMQEKVRDFCHWQRMKIKDFGPFILNQFFKGKKIKKRPEIAIRKRTPKLEIIQPVPIPPPEEPPEK